jgi:hypothetical protein
MAFTLTLDERLRGYTQGPPAYMLRRRRIEDLEARLLETIAAAEVPTVAASSADVTAALALLNDLIERHNRYYPIEANLPIDIRSGRIIDRGAPWRPLPAVSSADLVARLSDERAAARSR